MKAKKECDSLAQMPTAECPRVLVVYPHLPHYRFGVFRALEAQRDLRYEFAADVVANPATIPTIPFEDLRTVHRLRNIWIRGALWQRGLLRLVWTGRYDAVVFFADAAYVSTWVASVVCALRGQRVLHWTIGWHRPDAGPKRQVRKAFYRLADHLLLYGNVAYELGVQEGFNPDRMSVVGNSQASAPKRKSEEVASLGCAFTELANIDVPIALAVVRLTAAKRLDLLIRAVARLEESGRRTTLVLVGKGPERDALVQLAKELGVDARFPGPIYDESALAAIYAKSQVTVVPVNAGLTAIQSLTFGVPVITNDDKYNQAPESECIVPGVTGDYFQAGSVSGLAETMEKWIEAMLAEREAISKACKREVADNWSPQAHMQGIHAVVTKYVGHHERV